AASPSFAQVENPFQALRKYDFQSRKPVDEIAKRIRAAGREAHQLALIEIELDGVLNDAAATFAGKQEAAKFLWEIGTARSVPALAKALHNDQLANVARYALERNPDPSAASALRAALKGATGTRLTGLINSIGNR